MQQKIQKEKQKILKQIVQISSTVVGERFECAAGCQVYQQIQTMHRVPCRKVDAYENRVPCRKIDAYENCVPSRKIYAYEKASTAEKFMHIKNKEEWKQIQSLQMQCPRKQSPPSLIQKGKKCILGLKNVVLPFLPLGAKREFTQFLCS